VDALRVGDRTATSWRVAEGAPEGGLLVRQRCIVGQQSREEWTALVTKVFISYSREDWETADHLYRDLEAAGFKPWIDRHDLTGGEHWRHRIAEEIRRSNYFLALLSTHSLGKRGYVQKEVRIGLEVLDEHPIDQRYFVPVRLEECAPRDERLQNIHWIDLFPEYESGLAGLFNALGGKAGKVVRDERADVYPEILRLAMRVHQKAMEYSLIAGKGRQAFLAPTAKAAWAEVEQGSLTLMELREKVDVLSADEVRKATSDIVGFAIKCKRLAFTRVVKDTDSEMKEEFDLFQKELRPAFLKVTRAELKGK